MNAASVCAAFVDGVPEEKSVSFDRFVGDDPLSFPYNRSRIPDPLERSMETSNEDLGVANDMIKNVSALSRVLW